MNQKCPSSTLTVNPSQMFDLTQTSYTYNKKQNLQFKKQCNLKPTTAFGQGAARPFPVPRPEAVLLSCHLSRRNSWRSKSIEGPMTIDDHLWLVGGWATPLKNTNQLGWLFPVDGKIKHVPNHQPDDHCLSLIHFVEFPCFVMCPGFCWCKLPPSMVQYSEFPTKFGMHWGFFADSPSRCALNL